MDHPPRPALSTQQETPTTSQPSSSRPENGQRSNTNATNASEGAHSTRKRKNHRAGKKKRNRRQSFAAPPEDSPLHAGRQNHESLTVPGQSGPKPPFYRMGHSGGRNLSETSLDSEALLDHREHSFMRPRRDSRALQNAFAQKGSPQPGTSLRQSQDYTNPFVGRSRRQAHVSSGDDSDEEDKADDRTPLMSAGNRSRLGALRTTNYGADGNDSRGRVDSRKRQSSASSSNSPTQRRLPNRSNSGLLDWDVNNPPSMPGSPTLGPNGRYDDVMVAGFSASSRSPVEDRRATIASGDHLVAIDDDDLSPPSPRAAPGLRRQTIAGTAEEDVCFPIEGMSEIAEEDFTPREQENPYHASRRRRRRVWPDLDTLEDWSREEKEERSGGIRAKQISEPMLVGGRLRASKVAWHREEEDAPFRFTYFNEDFKDTIHAQTISELVQPGGSFQELFIPDPPELSDSEMDEEDDHLSTRDFGPDKQPLSPSSAQIRSRSGTRNASIIGEIAQEPRSQVESGDVTPSKGPSPGPKPKRYGPRPIWWLDVLSPTDTEMRVISKAFGVHALTSEDILMQEQREKVELFRNYYFINYRTFEQDVTSEDYLEPVNLFVIVFREGVISFHFSSTPHPANVRRRIRQLKDYMILTSDWISYAIIDDITDTYAPLIQTIEEEVDDIDDMILKLHSSNKDMLPEGKSEKDKNFNEKASDSGETVIPSGGDMLRRVGTCRKKVMGLYRLLGNKADVIKGFAKRCNEQWEVAPKSEIGLYLGDIQDHILTMTSNLSHYETLLSRAHSNYLAQINIRMNERQEMTADVLGKLTVLGTIVLPMNIICGMWGMNVKVPGQEIDNLYWFWSITAGLVVFAVVCFITAKRVYGIV